MSGVVTEDGDFTLVLCQRKGIVIVLEKDGTLFLFLDAEVVRGFDHSLPAFVGKTAVFLGEFGTEALRDLLNVQSKFIVDEVLVWAESQCGTCSSNDRKTESNC